MGWAYQLLFGAKVGQKNSSTSRFSAWALGF